MSRSMINKIVFKALIFLIIFIAKLIFTTQIIYGASLTLAWDANTEEDVAGYKIYYETSSRDYGETIDVGDATTYELSGLTDGTTYYIALTAYDPLNDESEKSDEISVSTNVAEICSDGIDNDADSYIDCDDLDCNNQTCNDDNICTTGDQCIDYMCQGILISCDDGNPCTDDSCDSQFGCQHLNNTSTCDDGNTCTISDYCATGICRGEIIVNCDDGNACNGLETCDPNIGCQSGIRLLCDDKNVCNGLETCDPVSGCQAGTPMYCFDGNICTNDICDPTVGCQYVPNSMPCDDTNVCNGRETCQGGVCVAGIFLDCDDGNICTDDECDPLSGCIYKNNTNSCDDSLFCNGEDFCNGSSCSVHSGDPCKQLYCNEDEDICDEISIICDNGNSCTTSTGKWKVTNETDSYGSNSLYTQKKATHTWTPDLPLKGYYEIYIWWPYMFSNCTNCPAIITSGGEILDTKYINQQLGGGQWNLLGTYYLHAGNLSNIKIKAKGSNSTCADAVKFIYNGEFLPEALIDSIYPNPASLGDEVCFEGHGVPIEGKSLIGYRWISSLDGEINTETSFCTSSLSEGTHQMTFKVQDSDGVWSLPAEEKLHIGKVEIICDNGDSCTSSTGRWKVTNERDSYGSNSLYAQKKATHTWTPDLPQKGYYEIYMWWPYMFSNCTNCPVIITSGGEILDTIYIDQQLDGGQWNLLGTYDLNGGKASSVQIKSEGSNSTTYADAVRFFLLQ